MELTKNQIDELYKFTRKHYVYHYDVQSELVDHLANDIENIWQETPNLSFEQARDKSFKKFGIFGFMDVVEKKQSQMTKKYYKIIFKFAKEWFRLPKIVLTLAMIFGFYKLQNVESSYTIYLIIFFIVMSAQLIGVFINSRKLNKKYLESGKKWMFEDIISINGLGNTALLIFYVFDFPFRTSGDFLLMGEFRKFLSAFLITFVVLLGYITLVVVPKKAQQLLQEMYPEYKLV
jgi:heme exporter protein D